MRAHTSNPTHSIAGKAIQNSNKSALRKFFAVVTGLAALAAVAGLSSCAGVTSAASAPQSQAQTQNPPAATGVLTPSAASVGFGAVSVGSASTQSVNLTNTGTAAVSISQAMISGTGFTIVGGSPTASLSAGQSTTVQVQFSPQSAAAVTGSMTVMSNATDSPLTVSLSGTGTTTPQPLISANPASAAFGNVADNTINSQSILLQNAGNATLTFSNVAVAGAGFSVTGLSTSTSIAAGGSATFNVIFDPSVGGAVNGSVVLTTNGSPAQLTIPLSGTGVTATYQLSASSTNMNFGSVNLNTSSQISTTLTNTGNSNVTISSVSVSGAGFSASGVSNGMVLQPTQTATLTVTFDPTVTGAVSGASVTIGSNAPSLPISLTATGVSYSVLVTWSPSTSSNVIGYYAYRSTTEGSGYTKLNPTAPVSSEQFTDNGVQAGVTYYYVVTAVDSSEVESADSQPATASIP
jgi:hypothetical protein